MTLLRITGFAGTLLLAILTANCSKKESVVAPTVAALIGTWQLIEPDSTYNITLQFAYDTRNPPQDITPFNASGKASINTYTVRLFAMLDGTLSADKLVHTDIAGSSQATLLEQAYFDGLNAVARYELPTQNRLRLYHGGNQPGVLVFKRIN